MLPPELLPKQLSPRAELGGDAGRGGRTITVGRGLANHSALQWLAAKVSQKNKEKLVELKNW